MCSTTFFTLSAEESNNGVRGKKMFLTLYIRNCSCDCRNVFAGADLERGEGLPGSNKPTFI